MDTNSFVLNVNTNDIIEDLYKLKDSFDFSTLDKDHEIFSERKTKQWLVNSKSKLENKNFSIDEFKCLGSKACSFKCEIGKNEI